MGAEKNGRTAFGFTEKEVVEALRCFGFSDSFEKIKYWYDGFRFGKQGDIYNPWSITKYLDTGEFKSYWANTSSNLLVDKLIREGEPDIKIAMEALLCDGQIETEIDEETTDDIRHAAQQTQDVSPHRHGASDSCSRRRDTADLRGMATDRSGRPPPAAIGRKQPGTA